MICKQCGNCCVTVGSTFWKGGNLKGDGRPFGDIDELNAVANDGRHIDEGLPCEMLSMRMGKAFCMIQERYGAKAKPRVCQDFDGDWRCGLKDYIERYI